MKHYNFLKKVVAGIMVATMVLSLGTVAFADEYATGTGIGVEKDYQELDALDITAVDAVYETRTVNAGEGNDSITVKDYTITITYTGATSEDQVTVLAYIYDEIYDENDAGLTAVPAASAIYAINQEAGSGETVIYLSTESELDENENELRKPVDGTETLIIKMGSNAEGISAAQAVRISLADVREPVDPILVTEVNDIGATVDFATSKEDLLDALETDYPTIGAVGNKVDKDNNETILEEGIELTLNVDWDAAVVTGLVDNMVKGDATITAPVVVDGFEYKNPSDLKVEVAVSMDPIAIPFTTSVSAVSVLVGATAQEVIDKIKTGRVGITLTDGGEVIEYISFADAVVTLPEGFSTTAELEDAGQATVVVPVESDYFTDTELTISVDLKVVAEATNYGDINNTGAVDIADVALAFNHAFNIEMLSDEQFVLADVNGTGAVDIADVALIFNRAFMADMYPGEVGKPFTELQN